jgi:hypothetical protein
VFPLPELTLEAHAFGNLKGRDDATLDVLAADRYFASAGLFVCRRKACAVALLCELSRSAGGFNLFDSARMRYKSNFRYD